MLGNERTEEVNRMVHNDLLRQHILTKSVVAGHVILASEKHSNVYIDLRMATLHAQAAPLIGRVMLDLTRDLCYDAVGGMTFGADPVALAMLHQASALGRGLDAFVVRKEEKGHGLQRRIEGPDVRGRKVLVVEDVCTTGASALMAVEALREARADVVGVAAVVDRGAREAFDAVGVPYFAAYTATELGLGWDTDMSRLG